jgi:hypothetical protein
MDSPVNIKNVGKQVSSSTANDEICEEDIESFEYSSPNISPSDVSMLSFTKGN